MFGKPEWFRIRRSGRGLTPITWRGWLYTLTWTVVICGPFLALVSQHLVIESLIWVAASMGTLYWDVRKITSAIRSADDRDVLYIGDEEDAPQQLTTRNYNLHLRD